MTNKRSKQPTENWFKHAVTLLGAILPTLIVIFLIFTLFDPIACPCQSIKHRIMLVGYPKIHGRQKPLLQKSPRYQMTTIGRTHH